MLKKIKWNEPTENAAQEVQNLIDQIVDTINYILMILDEKGVKNEF